MDTKIATFCSLLSIGFLLNALTVSARAAGDAPILLSQQPKLDSRASRPAMLTGGVSQTVVAAGTNCDCSKAQKLFKAGDYGRAAQEFRSFGNQLVREFGTGSALVGDARFSEAECYRKMGMNLHARQLYMIAANIYRYAAQHTAPSFQ